MLYNVARIMEGRTTTRMRAVRPAERTAGTEPGVCFRLVRPPAFAQCPAAGGVVEASPRGETFPADGCASQRADDEISARSVAPLDGPEVFYIVGRYGLANAERQFRDAREAVEYRDRRRQEGVDGESVFVGLLDLTGFRAHGPVFEIVDA